MTTPERAAARPEGGGEALGGLFVVLSSVMFASVPIMGRVVIESGLPIGGILATRFGITAALLAGILVIARRPLVPPSGRRIPLLAVGMFGYAVESSFYFAALDHGAVAPVTLLFFTFPVFVTAASWVLGRERPNRVTALALACGVGGAAIIVAAGRELSIEPLGVLLALCSALSYTAMIVGAERVFRGVHPLSGSLWVSGGAAIGLAASALLLGANQLPQGSEQWWPILGMGAVTAGAFWTLFAGLRWLGAVRASIIGSTEPFVVAVFGVVFLDEPIGPAIVVGGALIIAGAVLAGLSRPSSDAEAHLAQH
jgi:drug/metabolite transporter (DMT)-like permease